MQDRLQEEEGKEAWPQVVLHLGTEEVGKVAFHLGHRKEVV